MDVFVIYTYNISKLTSSKKVRFVYTLKGRGKEKGIIQILKGKFLAPGCFMISESKAKEIDQVFKLWGVIPKKQRIQLLK